ncbi:MAG: hypothetical protein LBS46_08965 [Dysgonamonadaceae bacterium]|jgi:hypothetical protein|nr:hypothetical protein [Dysgonamonadaceae bacterium]
MQKKKYVSPAVVIHRVEMEESIAETVMYTQVNGWLDDETIGDETSEGGDLYVAWY